jgi:SAM-dependent methyltransferase
MSTATTSSKPAAAPAFDAQKYKTTTTEQWQGAAAAWHGWGPIIDAWLAECTDAMLDLAGVGASSCVLDVAAGAGGQTVAAARRVAPGGRVLATDVSSNLLAYAKHSARMAGLGDIVDTAIMDGENLTVDAGSFDSVISRVGLIYFPDRRHALEGMRRALRPGGRFSAVTYSSPGANKFFSIPVSVIRAAANLPAPAPGQPGPFSLGDEDVLRGALEDAGFVDVEIRRMQAPLRLPSAADCVLFERESFGALHQLMGPLDADEREATWARITEELAEFEGEDGFVGPCEVLVVGGVNPS